jgi:hypothetical protein
MPTDILAKAKRKVFELEKTGREDISLTHEELDALADDAVIALKESGDKDATRKSFLCYGCGAASRCPYVYDGYNTTDDGVCLAEK